MNSGEIIKLIVSDILFSISTTFVLRVALLATTIHKYFYLMLSPYIETSHLIYNVKQMTGFYMKRNTELKWLKETLKLQFLTEQNE